MLRINYVSIVLMLQTQFVIELLSLSGDFQRAGGCWQEANTLKPGVAAAAVPQVLVL